MRKEMLIAYDVGEQRVAVLEDGQPVEVYLERPGRRSIAGNVYKGAVVNVLPGMEASFVEIGLEKHGFLYVDEIVVPELEGKRHGRRIQELVSRGQEVLVQAVKDPMGTKGARLTTEISLPGRFLVYTPFGDGIGVSRRLEDDERERLKGLCRGLELPEGGIIVRTAAEGASEAELAGDLALLRKLWLTIQGRAQRSKAPALVYREAELPLRVVRDVFRSDFERLAIDHESTYRRIVSYLKRTSPDLAERVEWYRDREPLMERSGVDAAVRSTLNRRVDLPSGGYLIFDYAEAFTVIDVNTGRFVGGRGKSSTGRLEDTITKNNLEAAKEIVRQLRLRDIGGIIVIDFIDMANPKNRQDVEDALKRELERDRTKTYVVEISPLGLVEMTRQNVTDGPREILTERCAVCRGDGIVVSDETYAVDAERALRRLAADARGEALLVELPARVAGILIGAGGSRLGELEQETRKLFAFETRDDLPLDHVRLLDEGTAGEIQGVLPVAAGQELELELLERRLHHPEDAIARVDGYVVAVAGAAGQVGRTVRVRIERATRTVAYASLAGGPGPGEAPLELGAVAEEDAGELAAPKRPAPRRRKPVAAPEETAEAGAAGAAKQPAPRRRKPAAEPRADEQAAESAAEPETRAAEDGAEPKKRTRRGTRGGRGRKQAPAATGETIETGGEDLSFGPDEPGSPGGAEAAPPDGEAAPRKRTRRGTRGGRGRRKTPALAANGDGASPTADGDEPLAELEVPSVDGSAEESAGEGEEAPRKRTRRGTRGGRGRKRSEPAGEAAVAIAEPVAGDAEAG
ncbi:MAG: Rne/Rng family ribonuclease [Thermoleophilia bacterium]|nr:Rne/Rng family ribonuclease [Thermoleophilia bacterium]